MVSVEPCKMHDSLPTNESGPYVFIASSIIPRAPLPDSGFMNAVGKPPTKSVLSPHQITQFTGALFGDDAVTGDTSSKFKLTTDDEWLTVEKSF